MSKGNTSNLDRVSKRRKYLKYIVFVIVGLIAAWAVYLWAYNDSFFTAKKSDAEQRAMQALDTATGSNAPVQSSFADEGCATSDIGWLGSSTGCGFAGKRYFKGSGNANQDVDAIDEKLRALGLAPTTETSINQLVQTKGGAGLVYTSKENVVVHLRYFANDPERPGLSARGFLQLPNDLPLSSNEYVYGVTAQASYYSCSIRSWIHAPCPAPPSTPTNRN